MATRVLALAVLATAVTGRVVYLAGAYRHGARAPITASPWNEHHYQSSEQYGNLTRLGVEQHREIGRQLRQKYGKELGLFDLDYVPEQVKVVSTHVYRTIQSVSEQLTGIFDGKNYVIDQVYGPYLVDGSMSYPVNFTVLPNGESTMLQGYMKVNCPRMRLIFRKLTSLPNFQSLEQEAVTELAPVLSLYFSNASTIKAISNHVNNLKCDVAEGVQLPTELMKIYDSLIWWEAMYRYLIPFQDKQALRLTCSEFFRTLLGEMEAALSGSKLKLSLFSAHEMSIGAFLLCLDLNPQTIPKFAASLFFELHDNGRVIVKYDNVHQRLSFCPEPCFFPKFQSGLVPFLVDNIAAECALDEGWESLIRVSYYS